LLSGSGRGGTSVETPEGKGRRKRERGPPNVARAKARNRRVKKGAKQGNKGGGLVALAIRGGYSIQVGAEILAWPKMVSTERENKGIPGHSVGLRKRRRGREEGGVALPHNIEASSAHHEYFKKGRR